MKSFIVTFLFLLITFSFFSCGTPPDVEITNAEFVEDIYVAGGGFLFIKGVQTKASMGDNGGWYSFENHSIIKLSLDLNFKSLNTSEDTGTEAHRSEVYSILTKYAHFYNNNNEVESIYGYWPEETSNTSASNFRLFYVIPDTTDLSKLKFEFDRSILGTNTGTYIFSDFAGMEPIEKKVE